VADAPHGKLYIDPALPDWMPDVTLSELTVGRESFSIRFWREGDATSHEVLAGDPGSVERLSFGKALAL
jgi:hypothetical protein